MHQSLASITIIILSETIEAGKSVDFCATCYPKRSGTKMFMVGMASNETSEYFEEEELYVSYGF